MKKFFNLVNFMNLVTLNYMINLKLVEDLNG